MPNQYTPASIDVSTGVGTPGSGGARRPANTGNNNRHCAAWEDASTAINLICDALNILGYSNTDPIRAAIASAIMNKNTGE